MKHLCLVLTLLVVAATQSFAQGVLRPRQVVISEVAPTPQGQGLRIDNASAGLRVKSGLTANDAGIICLLSDGVTATGHLCLQGEDSAGGMVIQAQGSALNINGSGTVNGQIVLNPGPVAGFASVIINAGHLGDHALSIEGITGQTGRIFEINDSLGVRMFHVEGEAAMGIAAGAVVARGMFPVSDNVYQLGSDTGFWKNLFVNEIKFENDKKIFMEDSAGTTHTMWHYDSSNNLTIGPTTDAFGDGDVIFYRDGTAITKLIKVVGRETFSAALDNVTDLGADGTLWGFAHIQRVNLGRTLVPRIKGELFFHTGLAAGSAILEAEDVNSDSVPDLELNAADFIPDVTELRSLGHGGGIPRRWAKLWVKDVDVSGFCAGCDSFAGVQGSIPFVGPGGGLIEDNANLFWDDTNNRLGLRTVLPAATIDITGDNAVAEDIVIIEEGTTSAHRPEIQLTSYNTTIPLPVFRARSAKGTKAAPTATQAENVLFMLAGHGWDATNLFHPAQADALWFLLAEENFTLTARGSYMRWETKSLGTITRTEKMRLTADGSLLVGVTSSTEKFEVGGRARFSYTDGSVTISTSGNAHEMRLVRSDNTNSAYSINIEKSRLGGSLADNDLIGRVVFTGDNSLGNGAEFAVMLGQALDVTAATEDGHMEFFSLVAGSVTNTADIGNISRFRFVEPMLDSTYTFGTDALRWSTGYFDTGNFGTTITGGGTVGMNWHPDGDGTRNLGGVAESWDNVNALNYRMENSNDVTIIELNNTSASATNFRLNDPSGGTRRINMGTFNTGNNDVAISLLGPVTADNIAITTANAGGVPALQIGELDVVRARLGAIADSTCTPDADWSANEQNCLTGFVLTINFILDRLRATGGHGLIAN